MTITTVTLPSPLHRSDVITGQKWLRLQAAAGIPHADWRKETEALSLFAFFAPPFAIRHFHVTTARSRAQHSMAIAQRTPHRAAAYSPSAHKGAMATAPAAAAAAASATTAASPHERPPGTIGVGVSFLVAFLILYTVLTHYVLFYYVSYGWTIEAAVSLSCCLTSGDSVCDADSECACVDCSSSSGRYSLTKLRSTAKADPSSPSVAGGTYNTKAGCARASRTANLTVCLCLFTRMHAGGGTHSDRIFPFRCTRSGSSTRSSATSS